MPQRHVFTPERLHGYCTVCGGHEGNGWHREDDRHLFKPTMVGDQPTYLCRTCSEWWDHPNHLPE